MAVSIYDTEVMKQLKSYFQIAPNYAGLLYSAALCKGPHLTKVVRSPWVQAHGEVAGNPGKRLPYIILNLVLRICFSFRFKIFLNEVAVLPTDKS